MTQPAKVLAPRDVRRVKARARRGCFALRNQIMVLLSFKAGLRACEIAGLTWSMVLTPRGKIAASITVAGTIAKNGRGRRIPMHPELVPALTLLHRRQGQPVSGPVIPSQRGGSHMRPRSVVNWFGALYAELELYGCSSHSGRRTFITGAARAITKAGGSLRDDYD
jgi:integrase